MNALEPHVSRRTMEFHHGKHHATYVNTLNGLIDGKSYEKMSLEDIICESFGKPEVRAIFNNAAQTWNHSFFWNSLQPNGGGEPRGELAKRLREGFGNYGSFRRIFTETAVGQFGSGWAWLVLRAGKLAVIGTPDARNPLLSSDVPLMTCDVWEHAYYLDYQNGRKAFVEAFLDHLVNWDHVAKQLLDAETRRAREQPAPPRASSGAR